MDEILTVCLIATLAYGVIITINIYKTNRKLKEVNEVLQEIELGKSRQKLLLKKNSIIDKIGFRLNSILYKYEELIEEANITLESNKQLLTSLSHDVRTPLTTLIGYLDAINLKLVDQEKQKEYLKLAKDKAYELKEYIGVLFDWFRLNSGEEILHIEPADIIETTRQILMDWIPILDERRMEYEINILEKVISVKIDVSCYMRIINNIIQNIMVHSKADKMVVSTIESQGSFFLRISDNGIGMEKDELKFIFERLYKCDEGRFGYGNGLGLNISKMLVEKMDGEIKVYSGRGEGTMFSIEFPIYYKEDMG